MDNEAGDVERVAHQLIGDAHNEIRSMLHEDRDDDGVGPLLSPRGDSPPRDEIRMVIVRARLGWGESLDRVGQLRPRQTVGRCATHMAAHRRQDARRKPASAVADHREDLRRRTRNGRKQPDGVRGGRHIARHQALEASERGQDLRVSAPALSRHGEDPSAPAAATSEVTPHSRTSPQTTPSASRSAGCMT